MNPHKQTSRRGLACDPFTGDGRDASRFRNPHAWTFALAGGGFGRAGSHARNRRAEIAATRAELRRVMRAARDVGAPHTWPVFAGWVR